VTGSRKGRQKQRRSNRRLGALDWEFVHVAVDDATRLAYAEVLSNEQGATAAGFVRRAIAWFARFGITVERVLSDNGACYRSRAHALALNEHQIRHLFTRPYRPRTNGKAERFIQTLTNRWAYGAIYGSSAERTAALPGWLTHYNFRRPHGSLSHKPPGARLRELTDVARATCSRSALIRPPARRVRGLGCAEPAGDLYPSWAVGRTRISLTLTCGGWETA
jgi:transposase InsO family protein